MAKIDHSELDKKSRSQYGMYQPESENVFLNFFYNTFLKNTPVKIFINGGITIGTFVYWLIAKDARPIIFWFFYILLLNISGLFYWRNEEKRLNNELSRLDKELQGLKSEILDRQKYFQDLKTKIDKEENN